MWIIPKNCREAEKFSYILRFFAWYRRRFQVIFDQNLDEVQCQENEKKKKKKKKPSKY